MPRSEEPRKVAKSDDHKVAAFVAAGPHPVEVRPAPPKAVAPPRVAPPPQQQEQQHQGDSDGEGEGEAIDFRQIIDYVGFVVRSVGRHKMLAAGTFAVTLTLAVVGTVLMPKTYYVQVKLLAQRNAVMTALSNPGRAVPWDADAPTRAAAETVLRRDNLISLIGQTDLINEWERRRAPILRLKDAVMAFVFQHEPTPDEKLDSLVAQLESKMFVSAGPIGDGTVTIELWWPDAEMAYRLVERAQAAFLEARQVAETSAIQESIGILERYTQSLNGDINTTLSELQRTERRDVPAAPRTARVTPRPRVTAAQAAIAAAIGSPTAPLAFDDVVVPDPSLARLRSDAASKRQELSRLEDERGRQLSELQARLSALRTVYTPNHPSVQSIEQNIAAFQYESPRIVALRNELEKVEADYDEQSAADAKRLIQADVDRRPAVAAAEPVAPVRETVVTDADPAPAQAAAPAPSLDQNVQFATLRLRTELNQLQSIMERTDAARIELEVSQAAFKYRYTVITPAQEPRDPAFPNTRLFILAGLLAAVMLALSASVASDLMSNRILEAWQVQRQLGLPILGTVAQ
jgi:uncharacterized protein involved in exopolysaccharide biosynthesis